MLESSKILSIFLFYKIQIQFFLERKCANLHQPIHTDSMFIEISNCRWGPPASLDERLSLGVVAIIS